MISKEQCFALMCSLFAGLYLHAQSCTLTAIVPSNLDTIQEIVQIQSEMVQYELFPATWENIEMMAPLSDPIVKLKPNDPVWITDTFLFVPTKASNEADQSLAPWIARPEHKIYHCTQAKLAAVERDAVTRDAYIDIQIKEAALVHLNQQVEVFPALPFYTMDDEAEVSTDNILSGFRMTRPLYEDIVTMQQMCCDGSGIPGSGCIENLFRPQTTMPYEYKSIISPATCAAKIIPADTVWIPNVEHKLLPGTEADKYPDALRLGRSILAYQASVDSITIQPETFAYPYRKLLSPATVQITTYPSEFETIERIVLKDTLGFKLQTASTYCKSMLNEAMVRVLQERLTDLGYTCGVIDGRIGPLTWEALATFQWENGLQVGGITKDTLQLLGIQTAFLPALDKSIRP